MVYGLLRDLLFALVIFVPLERLLPRSRDQAVLRRFWRTDLAFAIIGGVLILAGTMLVLVAGEALLVPLISDAAQPAIRSQPIWLQALEVAVLADIVYYAVHRLFHEVPFLWRLHKVHHSIEEMDWLAGHRVHPVDQILTRGLSLIVPFAIGFDVAALAAFSIVSAWHSHLKHSNVDVSFGPLRWLFVSPLYHHWHHANEQAAFNRNYAGQFPIIDIVMRTACLKEPLAPQSYGIDEPLPFGFVDKIVEPFRKERSAPESSTV